MNGGTQALLVNRRPVTTISDRVHSANHAFFFCSFFLFDGVENKRCHVAGFNAWTASASESDDFEATRGGVEHRAVSAAGVGAQARHCAPKVALAPDVLVKFPGLETRGAPKQLVRAVSKMSARQRDWVVEIGMGHLLQLEVTDTPSRLGFWLVSNFDPNDLSLTIQGHRKLQITKDDVAATLGMPFGGTVITKRRSQEVVKFLRDWRVACGRSDNQITVSELCDRLLADDKNGLWFKRHFSVLVGTTLIESNLNGTANQHFVHMLEDVGNIRHLDWCGHLLDYLVSTRREWAPHMGQKFTGPIVFLTLFYVDRVVVGSRTIPRAYPAMIGWAFEDLKHRQAVEMSSGSFGRGDIDPPLWSIVVGRPGFRPSNGCNAQAAAPTNTGGLELGDHEEPLGFVERFAAKAKLLATTVMEIVEMVGEAPQEVMGDPNFQHVLEAAQKILGLRGVSDIAAGPTATQQDDAFWADPNHIAALDEVEKAMLRRKNLEDMPSFSLGLTQECRSPVAPNVCDGRNEICTAAPTLEPLTDIDRAMSLEDMPSFSLGLTQECRSPVAPDVDGGLNGICTAAPPLESLTNINRAIQSDPCPPLRCVSNTMVVQLNV
nr:uncharacterized protein LOC109155364 [Ipomoea batatas]